MFTKKSLENVFNGDIIGKEIIFFDSISSTNDKAFEIGRKRGNSEGIVIIADTQTKGRGRLGRSWISPPGVNLYFTILLKPTLPQEEISILPLIISVAVVNAVRNNTGLKAAIKWPNDILMNGRKTGGILMEMKSAGGKITLLAVGIGINVNMHEDMVPEDIRPFTTSLSVEADRPVDRAGLLGEVLAEMEKTYKILLNGDKRALINEWHGLNSTIGKKVAVRCQDRVISGIAEGINDRGGLIVRLPEGEFETVNAGDVTMLHN